MKFKANVLFLKAGDWKDEKKNVTYYNLRVLVGSSVLKCKVSQQLYFTLKDLVVGSAHEFEFELSAYNEQATLTILGMVS